MRWMHRVRVLMPMRRSSCINLLRRLRRKLRMLRIGRAVNRVRGVHDVWVRLKYGPGRRRGRVHSGCRMGIIIILCFTMIGDFVIFMYVSHSHWVGGGESSASSASSSCCLAWALDCFSLGSARFLCRGFLVASVGAWVGRGGWCGNG